MDRVVVAQRDFSAGQLDDAVMRRDETDMMKAGLRTARNVRILNAGPIQRRPGRIRKHSHNGITYRIRPAVGEYWYMTLEPGLVTFRSDSFAASAFTGMPWDATLLDDLRFDVTGGNVIIVHPDFRPHIYSLNASTHVWTYAPFSVAEDQSGDFREPYHQFNVGTGITMAPSGRDGTISVQFSGPVLVPQHQGVRFRYGGRQLQVTFYHDAANCDAVCTEQLPPTYSVAVDNINGLQPGDEIEGVNSGCKGQVTFVDHVNNAFVVLVSTNWNGFDLTSGVGGGGEKIAGPRSSMTVNASTLVSPTASTNWEEAFMSDYRGWPGAVVADQQRLCFSNFRQYGAGIIWSAIGTLNDFAVGTDAADAIFEYIPENCQVLAVSGFLGDEIVLTDTGVYSIPISPSNPLQPGSVSFRRISNDGAASVRPEITTGGLAFVNTSRTRVLAVVLTSNTVTLSGSYTVMDLTAYHSDLIKSPRALAVTSSDVQSPERYLFAVNSDGTMAVAQYDRSQKWVGWVPWDGAGTVRWVSASGDQVTVDVTYTLAGSPVSYLEVFDEDTLIDCAAPVSGWAAGTALSVVQGDWYRGDYTVQSDGSLDGVIPPSIASTLSGGFNFQVEAAPFVPQVGEGPSRKQRLRRRRISQAACVVQRSQAVEVAGRLQPFWRAGENEEIAPPLRNEPIRVRMLGRSFDPTWSVKQDLPGALTILELTTEVTV